MRYLVLFILSLLFWLLITFRISVPNIVVGATASLLCTLLFGRFFVWKIRKLFEPHRYFWLFVYLFVFLYECIKANLEVAYLVLHPSMPIRPGIVKVKTELKSELARTLLANSITMTPGTITVDIVGDYFYIHWIYVKSEDPEVYTKMITGSFEKYIKRIIE
jgi:multicomponent Na+:H+ antiporter subunit E